MLALLLPGIRHTRTPLVSGAAWLLLVWLALGPGILIPTSHGSGLEKRFHALLSITTPGVAAASLAFVAVLIGGLIPPVPRRFAVFFEEHIYTPIISRFVSLPLLNRLINPLLPPGFWHPRPEDEIEETVSQEVVRSWATSWAELDEAEAPVSLARSLRIHREEIATVESDSEAAGYATQQDVDEAVETMRNESVDAHTLAAIVCEALMNEYEQLSILLQLDHASYYDDVDRLNSETELRRSLFAPLSLLIVVSAILSTLLLLLLLVIPAALLLQSNMREKQARMRVYTAARHGVILSESLQWVKALRQRGRPTEAGN